MTTHEHDEHAEHDEHGPSEASPPFAELMAEVLSTADRFAHRQHVHLTWLVR